MSRIVLIFVWMAGIYCPVSAKLTVDEENLVDHIVSRYEELWHNVERIEYDAELLEGSSEEDGELKVKDRFLKRVIVSVLPDTTLLEEEYLAYYKDGELRSEEDLREEAQKKIERREKSRSRGISWPILTPFFPDQREFYDIIYQGIADSLIDGYSCHIFKVLSRSEHDQRIHGTYYIDTDSFQPVRLDFRPSKLGGNTMFKLKQLDMTIWSEPTEYGIWLPTRFDISGKGRAALLVGISFAGRELYRNPQVIMRLEQDDKDAYPVE